MQRLSVYILSFAFILVNGCDRYPARFRTINEIRQLETSRGDEKLNRINLIIETLAALPSFQHHQIGSGWKALPEKETISGESTSTDDSGWKDAEIGFKWYENNYAYWFRQTITIPEKIDEFQAASQAVYLYVTVNDDEEIWVNGEKRSSFAMGSGQVLLSEFANPGETYFVAIKGFNGPGKGELIRVELRLASIIELQQKLSDLQTRMRGLLKARKKLPDIKQDWIDKIDICVSRMQNLMALKSADRIQKGFDEISLMIAEIQSERPLLPAFIVEPYLNQSLKQSATVSWETDIPADAEIRWGEKSSNENLKIIEAKTTLHRMTIDGLAPGCTYHYCVRSGMLWSPEYTLQTAPAANAGFKFAVWGDSHVGVEINERLSDLAIQSGAELLVQTGDAVSHGANKSEWIDSFFEPMRNFVCSHPVYLAAGNHEYGGYWDSYRSELYEYYLGFPDSSTWFSVAYGDAYFIFLDPNKNSPPFDIPPDSEQYAWLLNELNSLEFRNAIWHFMLFHQPPYSESWGGGYYDGEPELRKHIVPLLEKYPIDILFSGHTHAYERGRYPKDTGPVYIITGGAGGSLDTEHYKDWEQIDVFKYVHHFCLVEIKGERLTFEAIDQDGNRIDYFEMQPRSAAGE